MYVSLSSYTSLRSSNFCQFNIDKLQRTQKQHQQQLKSLSLQFLGQSNQYLSLLNFGTNAFIEQLTKLKIVSKQYAQYLFQNWSIVIAFIKQSNEIKNQIILSISVKEQFYKNIQLYLEKLKNNLNKCKYLKDIYSKIGSILKNIGQFYKLKQKYNKSSIIKGINMLFDAIFIPLRAIVNFKTNFERFFSILICIDKNFQNSVMNCYKQLIVNINQIPQQASDLGWNQQTLAGLYKYFPSELKQLYTNNIIPVVMKFQVIFKFQECNIYIIDRMLLLTKKDSYQPISSIFPSSIRLNSRSYAQILKNRLYLKNSVFICGQNIGYHFQFKDRLLYNCFLEVMNFRINIIPLLTNNNIKYNHYIQQKNQTDIRVQVQGLLNCCSQIIYIIKFKISKTKYFKQFIHQNKHTLIIQTLYLKPSQLIQLKEYLCNLYPQQDQLLKKLFAQSQILQVQQSKQYQCCNLTEFLCYIIRNVKFCESRSIICGKLGLSEGFYQLMYKISQYNYQQYCKCFDCLYGQDDISDIYFKLAYSQLKIQPRMSLDPYKHQSMGSFQPRAYCPLYLIKITDKYCSYLSKKHTQKNKESLKASILKREDNQVLSSQVQLAMLKTQIQKYRLFYGIHSKKPIPTVTIKIYDMNTKYSSVKILGLTRDSTVWHLKNLLAKRIEVNDMLMQSFMLSISDIKVNEFDPLYVINDQEYVVNILQTMKNHKSFQLLLRKSIKIPYKQFEKDIKQLKIAKIYKQLELQAAEMLQQFYSGWLCRYLEEDHDQLYYKIVTQCYIIWILNNSPNQSHQNFEIQELEKVPLINQQFLKKFINEGSQNLNTRQSLKAFDSAISQKTQQNRKKQLKQMIEQRLQQINKNFDILQSQQINNYRLLMLKQLIFIIDDSTDWYVEVFQGLICRKDELKQHEQVYLKNEQIFHKVLVRVSYYVILIKIMTEGFKQVISITYSQLKSINIISSFVHLSSTTDQFIIYTKHCSYLEKLIKFYKQFEIKQGYESQSKLKKALSGQSYFDTQQDYDIQHIQS